MLLTERDFGIFKIKHFFFAEEPDIVPDCDVVTYHTYKNWGDIKGFKKTTGPTTVIDLDQDMDAVWNTIKRQHRRHIRRAQKNGTVISLSNEYEEFYQNNIKFLKGRNFRDPFGFGAPSPEFMEKYGVLFMARHQGETLGGNFYINDDQNSLLISSLYGKPGNNTEINKRIADANCLLHWEAMHYFKNRGVVNYDLGGLGSDEFVISNKMHGLNYFKLSFGGKIISQSKYMKFNSRFYRFLYNSYNFVRARE